MPVTVRQLSPDEVAALTPETFTLAPIFNRQSLYAGLQGAILLAEVDGTPAGCAVLAFGGTRGDGGALHIDHFVVLPAFRDRGVGSRLMKALLDEARAAAASSVRADIPGWCPDWRSFYSRFGFVFTNPTTANSLTETTPVELQL